MKILLTIFCILFFISTNLFAKKINLLCETDWNIEKYPYKYITIEIDFENYVYVFDSETAPTYFYDYDKYSKEDIDDIEYAERKSITWNKNFISTYSYNLDLINLILVKRDFVFTCELTKRQIN